MLHAITYTLDDILLKMKSSMILFFVAISRRTKLKVSRSQQCAYRLRCPWLHTWFNRDELPLLRYPVNGWSLDDSLIFVFLGVESSTSSSLEVSMLCWRLGGVGRPFRWWEGAVSNIRLMAPPGAGGRLSHRDCPVNCCCWWWCCLDFFFFFLSEALRLSKVDDLEEEADEVADGVWRFFKRSRRELSAQDDLTSSNRSSSANMGESNDFDLQWKKIAIVLLGGLSSAVDLDTRTCCGWFMVVFFFDCALLCVFKILWPSY